jgi:membrane-bound ClpP family serine protease
MSSRNEEKHPALRAWLLVLASLIDDALVLVLVFLGLWYFHVRITWVIILVIVIAMAGFIVLMHKAVVPALRRRKVTGREGMLGQAGRVTQVLDPAGTVIINGEYWQASSIEGKIEVGEEVEVVGIDGLKLEVKKRRHE